MLTQEWIDGRPMKVLTEEEQLKMVQWGVECSSAQLFRTGLVHADPHEGNMLYTDDGKLALLDFGLICRVNNEQQEAMAGCILNILNRDWMDLIDNLRIIEMLHTTANVGRRGWQPGELHRRRGIVERRGRRVFPEAFQKCMDGDDPNKSRSNFTELVVDLTKLSTAWRFNLPPTWCSSSDRSPPSTFARKCATAGANIGRARRPASSVPRDGPEDPARSPAAAKILMNDEGGVKWKELMALAESAGAAGGGDADGSAPAPPSAMDKHTKASVNRLVSELIGSLSGSALRRILVAARPESLVPPEGVRAMIVKATRETFARSVAELTLGEFCALVARAVKSFFQAIFHAGKKTDEESDSREAFPEESSAAYASKVKLDKRRAEIARLMVRSKLGAPKGFASAAFMLALFGWAAATGAMLGVTRGIRLRLIEFWGARGSERGAGNPGGVESGRGSWVRRLGTTARARETGETGGREGG